MESLRNNPIIKFVLCALIIASIVTVILLNLEFNQLKQEKEDLAASISLLEYRVEQIQADLDSNLSDEYVMRIARERLNLRLPNEIIFYSDLTN